MTLVKRWLAFGRTRGETSGSAPAEGSEATVRSPASAWFGLVNEAVQAAKLSRVSAAAVAFAVILQVGYRLSLPRILEDVFDRGIGHRDGEALRTAIIQFALLILTFALAAVLQERGMAATATVVSRRLRGAIFGKLIAMPVQSQARHGLNFLDRMGADVDSIELATVQALPVWVMQAATTAASLVLLFIIEWRLALLVVISLPLMLQLAKPFDRRAEPAREEMTAIRTRMLALTQEASAGHMVLRLLGVGPIAVRRFLGLVDDMDKASSRWLFLSALSVRASQAAAGITQLAVVGLGGWLAFRGEISAGEVVAFVTLLANVTNGVGHIGESQAVLDRGAQAYAQVDALLSTPDQTNDIPGAVAMPPPTRSIAFDKVSFAYDGAEVVLHDISFDVRPGERVCLVGPSGSGKSTVAALLTRLLQPRSGAVRMDGVPLDQVTEASLRAAVTAVPQVSTLFEGTLRENIVMARPDASPAEVRKAIHGSALDPVVARIPGGLEAQVGKNGVLLSGGERQMVAIARALLSTAPVIVFDEATSALDPVSEARVNRTIAQTAAGRTVLAVTHRVANAQNFDRVLVFREGRLVQDGPHTALVAEAGPYRTMWRSARGLQAVVLDAEARVTPAVLLAIPLFAECPPDLLEMVADLLVVDDIPEKREIFRQGDPGGRFYILARGTVEVLIQKEGDEHPHQVAVLHDGDFFGEVALLSQATRNATVRTLNDCRLLSLHRTPFLALLEREPELKKRIMAAAGQRGLAISPALESA